MTKKKRLSPGWTGWWNGCKPPTYLKGKQWLLSRHLNIWKNSCTVLWNIDYDRGCDPTQLCSYINILNNNTNSPVAAVTLSRAEPGAVLRLDCHIHDDEEPLSLSEVLKLCPHIFSLIWYLCTAEKPESVCTLIWFKLGSQYVKYSSKTQRKWHLPCSFKTTDIYQPTVISEKTWCLRSWSQGCESFTKISPGATTMWEWNTPLAEIYTRLLYLCLSHDDPTHPDYSSQQRRQPCRGSAVGSELFLSLWMSTCMYSLLNQLKPISRG